MELGNLFNNAFQHTTPIFKNVIVPKTQDGNTAPCKPSVAPLVVVNVFGTSVLAAIKLNRQM